MENQWELDKENVQHAKGGRSVEQLNLSLAQSHSEDHQKYLKNKRQELELAIRFYSGDDPLLPYIDYVTWTEENYPSGGKDSQLYDLLKKCIKAFSQDKRYHQDARYINIFIAFAELEESKAAVTYDFMFHRGIGTMVAYFWYSYALALERKGDLKAAGDKYEHGIRCQAQPLDFLVEKFELFKRRLAQQAGLQSLMLDGNDTQTTRPLIGADSVLDQQQQQLASAAGGGGGNSRTRKALAALRTTAGGQAPVMRVGSAVSRNQSGLGHGQQQQQQQRHAAAAAGNRNPSAPFVVPASASVADENGSAAASAAGGRQRQGRGPQFEAVAEGFKENTMEPRPWNERGGLQESRRRDAAAASSTANADKPATLQVHEDDIPQLSASAAASVAPTPASAYKRGLSECAPKKPRPDQDDTSPSKLFGAFDLQQHQQQQQQQQMMQHQLKPGERFMCQIDKLYMGLQEVCFEELRAALRHPNAVPLKPPSTVSKQSQQPAPQWPQPPPPPQMQQQNSQDHSRDRSRDFSKDQSRDHSRDQASVEQQQSDALRESAAQCRRLAASNDALVRCREQLEQRIAELEHRLALATEEASRERSDKEALIRQVAELEDRIRVMYRERSEFSEKRARLEAELLRAERIQDDLEQRDAEIEELRRQVQQQQQQINEHRQQQQQQQQQHPPHPDSRTPMRAAKQPPSSLAAPSPTVNTKEAFKELHSLFRDAAPPRYPREMESMLVDEDEAAGKPAKPPASLQKQQQPQPAFEIFCDQSLVPQQQQQRQQDMQNTQKPAFEIFCDQSLLASEPKRSEQAQFKTPLPPPQPVQQKQQGEFKVPAPPSMQQQQQQQQQRSNKKGLAPQMPGSAAEQKPQPPADQTTSMSAAVAANLFGSGGETSVIEFTPSSQSTQIIRNPIRQPPVLGSLLERSSGASSASGGVGGSSGADPAAPEAAAEQQQQQHSMLANSQASIENAKLHGSTANASRFAAAAAASLASDSSAALTVVDDDYHRSTSRRRDSPSSSCRRTLIEEDKPETAAGAEAKPPPAAEDEDDTLAAFGIRSAAAASSTMSATVAGRAAACGFSIFGELEDELDNVEDEDEGGAGGVPNQTTIDLSATHTICVPDGLASASALVLSSSAPGAVHLALEPDLPFSQQSAHLWRPNANELKTQFAKDIVRGLGTNPFVNLRRNVRSIVHGSFHYRDIAKLASGAFGEVYTANERKLVLKWQSPPLLEEFLLIRLAHQRLSTQRWPDLPDCRPGLCDAVRVHAFKEASVLVQSCYSTGSLLHLVNRCITERSRLPEPVVAYISLELLYLVCSLHRARLLHADIKPDNLVFLGLPDLRPAVESAAAEGRPIDALSLIRDGRLHSVLLLDFGQAMEFSQLSGEGFVLRLHGGAAAKSRDKASATFLCPQMMSNQVWTCQCDLFNLASVIYCLIFQSYMTVTAGDSGVRLKGAPRLPRGWSAQVWPDLLQELMNSQSELCPTSLARHTAALAEIIHCKIKEYAACFNRPPISPP